MKDNPNNLSISEINKILEDKIASYKNIDSRHNKIVKAIEFLKENDDYVKVHADTLEFRRNECIDWLNELKIVDYENSKVKINPHVPVLSLSRLNCKESFFRETKNLDMYIFIPSKQKNKGAKMTDDSLFLWKSLVLYLLEQLRCIEEMILEEVSKVDKKKKMNGTISNEDVVIKWYVKFFDFCNKHKE